MWPFLRDGDIVEVRPDRAALRVGDLICYEPWPERLHVHRVVGRAGDDLLVRGDAQRDAERVPLAQVRGRVIAVTRGTRAWSLTAPSARVRGRAIVVIAPWVRRLLAGAMAARRSLRRG